MKAKKSPPKRQGTLFSFFSKKESPNKPKDSASKAESNTSSNSSAALSCTAQTTPQHSTGGGEKIVGERIKIFWRDDDKWYFGKVAAFSRSDGKHTIQYDDGDKEKLNLASEKVCYSD